MDAIKEIRKLSVGEPEILPDKWKNPYRILTGEGGTKNAYIFSVPVFSLNNYALISEEWKREKSTCVYSGINSEVVYKGRKITLENFIDFADIYIRKDSGCEIKPGMNGIVIASEKSEICFELKTGYPYPVRENGKSFALMQAKHLPFLTVTPFLAKNGDGRYASSFIEAQVCGERKYLLRVYSGAAQGRVSVEINLYFPKTVFDTTVESGAPDKNNVYGSYALLGNADESGEQRLLLRLNNVESMIEGLGEIFKADMYFPEFGKLKGEIGAFKISEPWCTFNTCWSDMPKAGEETTVLTETSGYLKADITEIFRIHPNYGIMLKSKQKNSLCAVSTADSYTNPLIIKIQYR